jgi:hypothetical protein
MFQEFNLGYNGITYVYHKDVSWPQALQPFSLPIVQGDNIDTLKVKIIVYRTNFKTSTHHIFLLCVYRFRFMEKCVAKNVHRFVHCK